MLSFTMLDGILSQNMHMNASIGPSCTAERKFIDFSSLTTSHCAPAVKHYLIPDVQLSTQDSLRFVPEQEDCASRRSG